MTTKTEKYLLNSSVAFMGTFISQWMILQWVGFNVYTYEGLSLLLATTVLIQIGLMLFIIILSMWWAFNRLKRCY